MTGYGTSKQTDFSRNDDLLGRKKLASGTTTRRLPWLDGKYLSTQSSSSRVDGSSRLEEIREDCNTTDQLSQLPSANKLTKASTHQLGGMGLLSSLKAQQYPSLSPSTDSTQASFHIRVADSTHDEARHSSTDILGRQSSLAQLPTHIEPPSPSLAERQVHVASPVFIKSAELSPTQPVPRRKTFERVRDARRLSNAVEGLEDLVQEAVDIVGDTNDSAQLEEVYNIIEGATSALREAGVPHTRQLMATTSPLEASSLSREHSECSSCSATSSELALPAVQQITPQNLKRRPSDFSLSSVLSSVEERRSRISSRSDVLLLPKHVHTEPRAQVDFVLRTATCREQPRGRSRRRRRSSDELSRKHHLHHRRTKKSADTLPRRHFQGYESLGHGRWAAPSEEGHDRCIQHRPDKGTPYGHELSVREEVRHHTFSLRRPHHHQPIARNWNIAKKRFTASIACLNTALLGMIVGIYAGEVPRIQYMLADEHHHAIIGNVVLYFGLAISTFVAWPLPLLHGRKAYILGSLALALPLQFPQAIVVGAKRSPKNSRFRTGLLVSRALTGLVLGFANVNFIAVLLDLFGASLQSKTPHQEVVVVSDIRRHGGGMGIWLGIWSWCWIGSLAIGFQIGAGIIEDLTPDWGFYTIIIVLAVALILNILTPETRRLPYRKSVTEVYDRDENFITRRVARGEIKLHISTEGPKYWFEEVWAGLKLSLMMCSQSGFMILAVYLGWIYAQIVLVIVLLGSLLSRDYKWYPRYVGLGVMSIAIGGILAVPLTKANVFSRERRNPFRTDSMTLQRQVTWTSHLVRRVVFTLTLPLMGLAYTVSSAGRPKPYMVPIVFAGAVGFLSILAIAECHGLVMETFDTCDLQPGVNTRHRLQSMAVQDRRRRTNYSSFPRVTAGIFVSQTLAFVGAAVATEVGGIMTRRLGAQASTGVTAGILLGLTILLTAVLWRFRQVQVIPNHTFGTRRDTKAWEEFKQMGKSDWKPVVIGNPSGKLRRMSALELGGLSRWTEIRKLNYLIRPKERRGPDEVV